MKKEVGSQNTLLLAELNPPLTSDICFLPKQILGRSAELHDTHKIVNFRTKLNSITEKLGCHFCRAKQSRQESRASRGVERQTTI